MTTVFINKLGYYIPPEIWNEILKHVNPSTHGIYRTISIFFSELIKPMNRLPNHKIRTNLCYLPLIKLCLDIKTKRHNNLMQLITNTWHQFIKGICFTSFSDPKLNNGYNIREVFYDEISNDLKRNNSVELFAVWIANYNFDLPKFWKLNFNTISQTNIIRYKNNGVDTHKKIKTIKINLLKIKLDDKIINQLDNKKIIKKAKKGCFEAYKFKLQNYTLGYKCTIDIILLTYNKFIYLQSIL